MQQVDQLRANEPQRGFRLYAAAGTWLERLEAGHQHCELTVALTATAHYKGEHVITGVKMTT